MLKRGCCFRTTSGQVHPDVVFTANKQGFVAAVGDNEQKSPVKASKIYTYSLIIPNFVCFSQTSQSSIQSYPGENLPNQ